jgi:molybdopterin molybdotransferase
MTEKTNRPAQPSCADDFDPNAMLAKQALQVILDQVEVLEDRESLFINDCLDRIVADNVTSSINVPGFDNSAMDGYALRGTDLETDPQARLKVVGKAFAGHPYTDTVNPGECVRIMTGAPMPAGADTVVMQEQVSVEEDYISCNVPVKCGQNVRLAGEDIAADSVVFQQGHKITPADLGLLASLGIAEVKVSPKVRVAFFSTGDELKSLGETLEPGQIYDSNRYTLYGLLKKVGADIIDLGVIKDDPATIEQALAAAQQKADVIITTGGVSVGEADYIKDMLDKLGQIHFWKISMKPGRPLAFGKLGKTDFFGLPGNPVSAMVTFYQYVAPAIKQKAGQKAGSNMGFYAKCASKLNKRPGRIEYQRGILHFENGEAIVTSTGQQGSHILKSMSQANCFIVLPLENDGIAPGDRVEVQPLEFLL